MDYVDLLKDQCPPAIVQYVLNSDLSLGRTRPWPEVGFGKPDVTAGCRIAALLYRSSVLPRDVGYRIADYVIADTLIYYDQISAADRPTLLGALRKLAQEEELPFGFYSMITRNRIDVRDVLQRRFLTLPAPENATPKENSEAFAYLQYLVAMGNETVLPRMIEALKIEPAPGWVMMHLDRMEQLRLPQSDQILREFIDDRRQALSVFGDPGVVIANFARLRLNLPPLEGPFIPLDNLGNPYRP